MNMHDPRLGMRTETAAMEARIAGQHPGLRRRSPIKALLITLVVLIALVIGVVVWMGSVATTSDPSEPTTGQQ